MEVTVVKVYVCACLLLNRKRKRKLEFNAVCTASETPPLPDFPDDVETDEPVMSSSRIEAVPETQMTQQASGLQESGTLTSPANSGKVEQEF